jgi:hypothetical protein
MGLDDLLPSVRVVTLLTILAGTFPRTHAMWGAFENAKLERKIAALKVAGEPVTAADLQLDAMPKEANASLDFKAAGESIDENTAAYKLWQDAIPDRFRYPYTPEALTTVRQIVAENKVALQKVRAARGKTAGGWDDRFDPAKYAIDQHIRLWPERSLGNLLSFAARTARAGGDDAEAVQLLIDGMTVAKASQKRPTLAAHVTALGMASIPAYTASAIAPDLKIGSGGASRAQVAELIRLLLDEKSIDDGARLGWNSERMTDIEMMRATIDGRLKIEGVPVPPPNAVDTDSAALKPLIIADALAKVDFRREFMEAELAPDWTVAQRRIPADYQERYIRDPMIRMMSGSPDHVVKIAFHTRTTCRLAAVALAARLYEADHDGKVPGDLSDLVPAYIPAVPIDPMSGKPLLYAGDNPRVYSVGDDGVDDGGFPVDRRRTDGRPRESGDIVVYLRTQPR